MSRRLIAAWLAVAALAAPMVTAQEESAEALRERLRRLETRSAVQDARIKELEARLADRETERPIESELEIAMNALATEMESNVTAPRSESAKFGGQLRFRGEFRSVKNYSGREDDSVDFVIQRTRFHGDFRVLPNVRAFVQFQDSRNWGEEGSTLADLEGVDIHQAFVDFENVFGAPLTFRVGRQELSYGDQRLVSPLDWHPVGRSFDGVRTMYEREDFQFDVFAMNIVEGSIGPGGDAGDDHYFAGIYFAYEGIEAHELDLYVFYRSFATGSITAEDGSTGDLEDATFGVRFKGRTGGFDYSIELVGQAGNRAGDDVLAYAGAAVFGFTFDSDWKPRIGVEWDFASGDDDPTDGDFETFDPLFAFVHAYQGYLDIWAWRNGHDIVGKISIRPTADLFVEAAFHVFILDSNSDAWYNAPGLPIRRAPGGGVDDLVGFELDLHAKYTLNESTHLWFGYSHFFAGDYVEETGQSPDTDWVFFQLTLNF